MNKNLAILLVTLLSGFLNCQGYTDTDDMFEEELILVVNKLRVKGCTCGDVYMPPVKPLKWNENLQKASLRHAQDMKENHYFSHTGSDGSTVALRVTDIGYDWSAVGENIAHGYESIPEVVQGWKKSTSHCKNMMKAAYTEMGVARVHTYWAQTFAKPRMKLAVGSEQ